ncbi:ATP-binding protein [Luteimonas sp. FCS-9]|uniref:ATP-binding protein n=1 Tax=Luteimonas sp. FCS-9 TaxID=1547516 RepID=UPI00063EC037|nr:ATP-binding protein [Luteimonas sp. FCS-9]KLJ02721.1 histidine kinase [Luteimonas sp. FCS-9]
MPTSVLSCIEEGVYLYGGDGRLLYANPTGDALQRLHPAWSANACRLDALLPPEALAQAHATGRWRDQVAFGDGTQIAARLYRLSADDDRFLLVLQDPARPRRGDDELLQRHQELNVRFNAAQEQLLQAEKLASIGQLAAGVAHEINNPIGYVHSNLGSLQEYVGNLFALIDVYERALRSDEPHAMRAEIDATRERLDIDFISRDLPQLLSESRQGIERVTRIVRDLRDFSRSDREHAWRLADLHAGLESTINIVWNELRYKATLEKAYGTLPMVECLQSELNQVFMNLLLNAGQAIEEQGTITVRTGQEGEQVWVEIADTGNGIPAEMLQRIFDPFFTTKPVGKGTGLGLSISYGIVAKHHGRIEVDSAPGAGSRFRIVLPVRQPVGAH